MGQICWGTNLQDTIQQETFVVVEDIIVEGNKQTKKELIFRELSFSIGDTLFVDQLEEVLKVSRDQVYNTRLFNEVTIHKDDLINRDDQVKVVIKVEERWYIFPVPIFELVDRNFNVWWNGSDNGKKRDLSRLVYGMRFAHENFRGRREQLKAVAQFGFTRKFELFYEIPFIDKQKKTGIFPTISYIMNRKIATRSAENKLSIYEHEGGNALTRFRAGIAVNHRPDINFNHHFNLTYYNNQIADTVALMSPDYFLDGQTRQRYLYFAYLFTADFRDIRAYPLKGSYFRIQLTKAGFGIFDELNMFWAIANYSKYMPINDKWYTAANIRLRFSLPDRQPYFNRGGLGFGSDYIRGYEYYAIEGQHFLMARSALKYQLIDTKFKNPFIKADQFKTIPLAIYFKTYGELGYVKEKFQNDFSPLSNQWLAGTGIGFDIFTMYDTVFSLEYTINALREHGFYVAFAVNYDF